VEGKDDRCAAGEEPKPFEYYLHPELWQKAVQELMVSGGEFARHKPTWREVGLLGPMRIRAVRYPSGEEPWALDIVLAESGRSRFVPLMRWSGEMPPATVHKVGKVLVLVVSKDFGGNVPMVRTWAWIGGPHGPIRLSVDSAIEAAIHELGSHYGGYNSGLDWDTLHCRTGVWEDQYPGKVGVGEEMEAWFAIEHGALGFV
jgi:hypothetical protein